MGLLRVVCTVITFLIKDLATELCVQFRFLKIVVIERHLYSAVC